MSVRSFENHSPQLGNKVFVDQTALVVGQVTIGDDSSIWPMTTIRGDVHCISIGTRTSVQDGSVLHVTHASTYNPKGHDLVIGDNVTIGHKAMIHGCTIENNCLIGMGAVVMDDAVIHSNVILGANSLVPPGKTLEGGFLWVGSPARKIRPITDEEKKFFQYSADNYVKLKDRHLAE
ncbi:MAG: carbonic anhydrase/acetyltransferase-like protein (isoleucine patch superfamily) [Polaribacter sp.]|jgi:carbonic anhydrase/acetyltransferase-like protein (isoleucine patch superfamily)